MSCTAWTEQIVECVRRGDEPPAEMAWHLRDCAVCREMWTRQESLQAPLARLRAAGLNVPLPARLRPHVAAPVPKRRGWRLWSWAAAGAAAVLIAVLLLPALRRTPGVAVVDQDETALVSFADVTEENGFVAVPYTMPLASGESIRVVREELSGAEMASMGLDTPGSYDQEFEADVVLGDDGIPRAVRLVGFPEI